AAHAAWRAELEAARGDHDEHNRLEGVAAGLAAARERQGLVRAAAAAVHERARELAQAAGLESSDAAFEGLARALSEATAGAQRLVAEARREEEAAERELVDAERQLGVLKDRLVEATRRRDEHAVQKARLERLRAARDHVAHACSVLRGTSGEGPLSAALWKALGDLPGRLAEARVRRVSAHARRIYRALAPHETWDLAWDPKTYVLALAAPGTDPSAAVRLGIAVDDMSGGQQMSAALALHLALVHTYARHCDLLFLDEPTTNLDA